MTRLLALWTKETLALLRDRHGLAAERRPPINAYLLLLDQPANSTAYTASPAIAMKNRMPISKSATPQVGVMGTMQ